MDPAVAVWVALALNAGGVVMMLGAKRQQLNDLAKRMDGAEEDIGNLDHGKLSVSDYHREQAQVGARIVEVDGRAVRDIGLVNDRCTRIEIVMRTR